MGLAWIEHDNGIAWEESDMLHDAGLCHGVTGRGGGVSQGVYQSLNLSLSVGDDVLAVLENRRRLCKTLGISINQITTVQQGQSNHIIVVGRYECGCGAGSAQDAIPHADAALTNCKGVLLLMQVADAVPVILFDSKQNACAVIHAGMYNTAANIVVKTVRAMEFVYGSQPQHMMAYIGPSICFRHLAISRTLAEKLLAMDYVQSAWVQHKHGVFTADLQAIQYHMLCQAGLQASHIEVSCQCVVENPQRFFSYRRDNSHTGRMAAFAMLP